MAFAKSAKRMATELAETAAAKRAKSQGPGVEWVIEGLLQCELPNTSRTMLVAGAPMALADAFDERHSAQAAVVQLIGNAISQRRLCLEQALESESAKFAQLEASHGDLQNAKARAEDTAASSATDMSSKACKLIECGAASEVANNDLTRFQENRRKGDELFQQAQSARNRLQDGLVNNLNVIKEGLSDDLGGHYELLLPLLKELPLDDSLRGIMKSTCLKNVGARGTFDTMVLEQLATQMRDRIETLDVAAKEAETAANTLVQLFENGQAVLDACTARQAEAACELEVAEKAAHEANSALRVADEALVAYEPGLAKAIKSRGEKKADLDNFVEINFSEFVRLRDRRAAETAAPGGGA